MDAQKIYNALDNLQKIVNNADSSKSFIIDVIQQIKDDIEEGVYN